MRLETASPNNQRRVAFLAQSALDAYAEKPKSAAFHIGMFSDALRQRGLVEQKQLAKQTLKNVLKGGNDYAEKIRVVECLMFFSYLCGWHGADSVFQKSLEKMQLNAKFKA